MHSPSRHQCLIYQGPPSRLLPALAAQLQDKLKDNHRCLYLNSPVMVAGMASQLAAGGVDVAHQVGKGNLVLSSDVEHLSAGKFDVNHMMRTLDEAVQRALDDGYSGLWATGDMTWELGPKNDFSRLLEYEWRLEELFQKYAALGGICQYHGDTLPREALRKGLQAHPSIFVNETLSMINPHYLRVGSIDHTQIDAALEATIERLCSCGEMA